MREGARKIRQREREQNRWGCGGGGGGGGGGRGGEETERDRERKRDSDRHRERRQSSHLSLGSASFLRTSISNSSTFFFPNTEDSITSAEAKVDVTSPAHTEMITKGDK